MKINPRMLQSTTSPQKIFIILASIFGFLFLIVTPPFQVADEYHHFYRAFHVSEGNFLAEKKGNLVGGMLPLSLTTTAANVSQNIPFHSENKQTINDILSVMNIPMDYSKKGFVHFPNTALYSAIPYLPQSIGINFGKIFDLSPLICMYLGRLSNLLSWIFLVFISIKTIPVFKWVLLLLALTPMSLFQASSLSADAFTNGIAFLFIATVLRYTFDETENMHFTKESLFVLLLLSMLLTLSKNVYIVTLLLVVLIPKKRFHSLKAHFVFVSLLFLFNASLFLGLSSLANNLWVNLRPELIVSPPDQIMYILDKPIEYCLVIITTFINYLSINLDQFIGVLGWLDTPLPSIIIFLYFNPLCKIDLDKKIMRISLFFLILKLVKININRRIGNAQNRNNL